MDAQIERPELERRKLAAEVEKLRFDRRVRWWKFGLGFLPAVGGVVLAVWQFDAAEHKIRLAELREERAVFMEERAAFKVSKAEEQLSALNADITRLSQDKAKGDKELAETRYAIATAKKEKREGRTESAWRTIEKVPFDSDCILRCAERYPDLSEDYRKCAGDCGIK